MLTEIQVRDTKFEFINRSSNLDFTPSFEIFHLDKIISPVTTAIMNLVKTEF